MGATRVPSVASWRTSSVRPISGSNGDQEVVHVGASEELRAYECEG